MTPSGGGAGGQDTRVYAVDGATGDFLPGWPIKIAGVIQNVLPLIGPGHDPAVATIGGEKRKLEIARALVTSPKLILLDEPFSGVDPIAVEDLQREIRRMVLWLGLAALPVTTPLVKER